MASLSSPPDATDSSPSLARHQPSEPAAKPCSLSQSSHETTHPNSPNCQFRQSFESQALTQKELDEKPWKYIGYKGYSSFLASENDFLVFRRFSTVSIRIALRLQDRVGVLEEELSACDRVLSSKEAQDIHNGSFRQEDDERERILDDIQKALLEYNTFILQQAEVKNFPRASAVDVESLMNWHYNHNDCAIAEEEQKYLTQVHDLLSLVPRVKTPLRRLLDRWKKFRVHPFWRDEKSPELPVYDQGLVTYFSDKKVDRFITIVIVGIGTVMLIAPMWILQALTALIPKLRTITAFIVLFLGMISYATVAKPFETLAATAAYSAILVVFLQLGSNSVGSVAI